MGVLETCFAIGVIGIIGLVLFRRVERFKKLRLEWANLEADWTEAVGTAMGRYVDQYGKREGMSYLARAAGKTGVLYAQVAREADDIYVPIRAIDARIKSLSALASRASAWNLTPLVNAIGGIDDDFQFKTDGLNETGLFGAPNATITASPRSLREELTARFCANVDGWNRLCRAVEARGLPATVRCSPNGIDRLRLRMETWGIPARWIADHPLSGDGDANRNYWDKLDDLRASDPVAYLEEAERFDVLEREMEERVDRLVATTRLAGIWQNIPPPAQITDMVIDPDDNPVIAFDIAKRARHELAVCLALGERVEEVEERSEAVRAAYRHVSSLNDRVMSARGDYEAALAEFDNKKLIAMMSAQRNACARLEQCQGVHSDERPAASIKNGEEYMAAALIRCVHAQELHKQTRVLDAIRELAEAGKRAGTAIFHFEESVKWIDVLDAEKQRREQAAVRNLEAYTRALSGVTMVG